ncbi:MAG TPA: RNA ligase family protein [Candidatus Saccharimonadales bacterium]|nr:RNA ligase family protein [Candidatus Saccharimonadales bacterium]
MDFQAWPKISRLNSPYIITEKIDGTNACVLVDENGRVQAQSRTRLITPEQDNYGFARWVYDNSDVLAAALGPGYHFGEWWGQGIQRRYNADQKYFSLFNSTRWDGFNHPNAPLYDIGVRVVPVISQGEQFQAGTVLDAVDLLQKEGSLASPGYDRPEGLVVHFLHNRINFKYILDK